MFGDLVNEKDWIKWFMDAVREHGGRYIPYRFMDGGAAKITGRRLMKRQIPFVREFPSKARVDAAINMLQAKEQASEGDSKAQGEVARQRRELETMYYRDNHGSLRRVLAK